MDNEKSLDKISQSLEQISSEDMAKVLDKMITQAFPVEKLNSLIKDLCEADATVFLKSGGSVKLPDWAARDKGLDKLLKIHPATRKQIGDDNRPAVPAKIIFVTVNNLQTEKKEIIDVTEATNQSLPDLPGTGLPGT